MEKKHSSIPTIKLFFEVLLKQSLLMLQTGRKIEYPVLYSDTFVKRARLSRKNEYPLQNFSYEGSECGWLMYALLETEIDNSAIKDIFDKKILQKRINRVHQSQYALVALLLFKQTGNSKYKKVADEMYRYLCCQDTEFGIVFSENDKDNRVLVDSLGMAVPFLMEYSKCFDEPRAKLLAEKSIEMYAIFGCDNLTGIPAFSFKIKEPHIKCGSANWGRGIAWYALGLLYINEKNLSNQAKEKIALFNRTLSLIWDRDECFTHFLCEENRDLSAELPILYYLCSKGTVIIHEDQLLEYSTMCHNGVMYNSSSSNVGIVPYGMPYGPNALSQAYMIRIITLYEKKILNNEQ